MQLYLDYSLVDTGDVIYILFWQYPLLVGLLLSIILSVCRIHHIMHTLDKICLKFIIKAIIFVGLWFGNKRSTVQEFNLIIYFDKGMRHNLETCFYIFAFGNSLSHWLFCFCLQFYIFIVNDLMECRMCVCVCACVRALFWVCLCSFAM